MTLKLERMIWPQRILCACLLLSWVLAVALVVGEPLRLGLGVSDTSTFVGRLFRYGIPRNAFSGVNIKYRIEDHIGKPLPKWIVFDEKKNVLEGVPTPDDVGDNYILVKAFDGEGTTVRDVFSLQVLSGAMLERNSNDKRKCKAGENVAMLSLVIDKALVDISPTERIMAIKNLAGFLGIETNQLTMLPQKYQDSSTDSILASGQGDVKRKSSHASTVIMWQVGCEGEIWSEKIPEVQQMKQIARDGTLSEVLQQRVIGWHIINNMNPFRERMDMLNDAANKSSDEGVDDENDIDEIPITTIKPLRHRHRHGEGEGGDNSSLLVSEEKFPASPPPSISLFENEPTSPITIDQLSPDSPKWNRSEIGITLPTSSEESSKTTTNSIDTILSSASSAENELTSMQSSPTFPPDTGTTSGMTSFVSSNATSSLDEFLPPLSTQAGHSSSSSSPTSTLRTTSRTSSSPGTKLVASGIPPVRSTSKQVENNNSPPDLRHPLQKVPFTAGKPSFFQIPDNIFYDEEQGDTRHLKVLFHPDSPTSWIQFNATSQEVYALPLEEHVSRWMYDIIAIDRFGANVSNTLEVFVQHHRGYRTVTHEISLAIQMESLGTLKFATMVDWQLFVYNKLLDIYGNSGNTSYITVRSVVTNREPYIFTYTNESLPKNECPTSQILGLLEVISNTTTFQPNSVLTNAFGKLMTVKNVTWKGVGHCEESPSVVTKHKYLENLVPVIRNPIDHLDAIIGELLVYPVPEDTFFDRENGGTRNLRLSLLTMDRTTIPQTHWLQFDTKNQEFYGIPQTSDAGRKEYQLVAEDNAGASANDGLEVIVKQPTTRYYSAEFSVVVAKPYTAFSKPIVRRQFVEKIGKLFGDKTAANIVNVEFEGEKHAPAARTIVRWSNRTLGSDVECPEKMIGDLRQVLFFDDNILQENLISSFEKDFDIIEASVKPTGICEGLKTPIHVSGVDRKPAFPGKAMTNNASVEYLITFVVPLVVIICMLLCASIIACLLYRRRRTGKMSVANGDEGVIIHSKGIPVIFQDELEERLEPTNKTPIILKEEKPPLPPPEYQRGHPTVTTALLSDVEDSSPYQPPPPFTTARGDTGSNPRPTKPTPTYRMPPPYLPP